MNLDLAILGDFCLCLARHHKLSSDRAVAARRDVVALELPLLIGLQPFADQPCVKFLIDDEKPIDQFWRHL